MKFPKKMIVKTALLSLGLVAAMQTAVAEEQMALSDESPALAANMETAAADATTATPAPATETVGKGTATNSAKSTKTVDGKKTVRKSDGKRKPTDREPSSNEVKK